MKTHTNKYDDFLFNYDKEQLHNKLNRTLQTVTNNISDFNNTLLYGPPGIGKYTTSLAIIRRYSNTKLVYEKKTSIMCNNMEYFIKISDIHYEVDFALLGCNAKTLWNNIYQHIVDIVQTKTQRIGIILCKNFHAIHGELLETFYSYMQTQMHNTIYIKFLFLTESVSFIPNNILQRCHVIHMARPARTTYNRCISVKIPKSFLLSDIDNIKTLQLSNKLIIHHKNICDKILNNIMDIEKYSISILRDNLYNILFYNLDIHECIWYIFNELCNKNDFSQLQMFELLLETHKFFVYFNNNYRPIYHLENYTMYIIKTIHGYGDGM